MEQLKIVLCQRQPLASWVFLVLQLSVVGGSNPVRSLLPNPVVREYRWGAWTEYSTCTRSCGIGIKVRQRACFSYGGTPQPVDAAFCGGVSISARTCNTQPCPRGARDFRSLQCSFFNGKKHGGREYNAWVPYRTAKFGRRGKIGACALACTPHNNGHFVVQFSRQVVDGTECGDKQHGVCVSGECVAVGCDHQLKSRAHQDWCGICGGDNSSCDTLSGNIAKNITVGYDQLLTIPAGARHVRIVERDSREVLLALGNTQGHILIDGHRENRHSTLTRLVAGTLFYYHHPLHESRGMETFRAEGPTSEDLVVMGHTNEKTSPVTILYEYTVNNQPTLYIPPRFHSAPEKSLPWEAILYEKLHPGYNIGTVGSAYVKRKKDSEGKSFHFKIPPWKPPEPRLPVNARAPGADSRWQGPNYRRQTSPPIYQGRSQRLIPWQTSTYPANVTLTSTLPTSLSQQTTLSTSRTPTLTTNFQTSNTDDSSTSSQFSTFSISTEESPLSNKNKVSPNTSTTTTGVYSSSGYTNGSATATKQVSVSGISQPTSTSVPPGANTTHSMATAKAENTSGKVLVTDQIPVFIPAETDEEQGFEMTDFISSTLGRLKSDNASEARDLHHVFDIHHLEQDSQASFSQQQGDKQDEYSQSYDRPENRADPRYHWRPKSITPCSSTCAPGGVQFEFFECRRVVDGLVVRDSYCDPRSKPDARYHECTRQHCVARWVSGIWSHCSRSCGEGQTFRSVRCWRMLAPGFDSTVHADQCRAYDKPEATRKCNEGACGPQWQYSEWGKCSVDCGRGTQLRTVRCNTGHARDCQSSPRPTARRACGGARCDAHWETTKWGSCSGPCGSGIKQRRVTCRGSRGRVMDERSCDSQTKPLSVHSCGDADSCPFGWVPQRWGECSAECGEGVASRSVICGAVSNRRFQQHPDTYCQHLTRPVTRARCRETACEPVWLTTEWSKCSKSCGRGGVKMREVRCYLDNEESDKCDSSRKPKTSEECPLQRCPDDRQDRDSSCVDDKRRINCDLVLRVQLCHHWYYKTACCKSCRLLQSKPRAEVRG